MNDYIAWDIGGAHLKYAQISCDGVLKSAAQIPCPMWKGIDLFKAAVSEVLQISSPTALHAVTMTGEMADCFVSRDVGVARILEAFQAELGKQFQVYLVGRGLCDVQIALQNTHQVAAANWHASAACVAQLKESGILIDMGSTTTDIIPFDRKNVLAAGSNDRERLELGELVYTGIVRTAVMAVSDKIKIGQRCLPVVAEQFATMADVYRLTRKLPEYADQYPACDGGAKTVIGSAKRLARMFAYDYNGDEAFWREVAHLLSEKQKAAITQACLKVYDRCRFDSKVPIIGAGVGQFLLKQIAEENNFPYCRFSDLFEINEFDASCASAISLAWLLHRWQQA